MKQVANGSGWSALPYVVVLGLLAALPVGCKDESPCDPGQEATGVGCFPIKMSTGGSSNGGTTMPEAGQAGDASAGAAGEVGAAGAPAGNPDATFGTMCQTNADCGGDAPICATDPLWYCSQINCDDGEENAGACPADWVCFKYGDNPSACVNPSSF
jgi:hypothetical protein